jgi:hypothetical protein
MKDERGNPMNMKGLLVIAVSALCFCVAGAAMAHAQSCDVNPVDQGCPNPCYFTPGATVGCDPLIVCDGQTITDCDENIAASTRSICAGLSCLARLKDRSIEKEVAALLPRKSHGSCQMAALPKKVLFSPETN